VRRRGGKLSKVGDVFHGGLTGSGTASAIKDGAIVITLNNAPYQATVFKLGDKYYAARSNDFGYANYEVVPTTQTLDPLAQRPTRSGRWRPSGSWSA